MKLNDALPVTLLAASDYPDPAFREHLNEQIEAWVLSLKPRYSATEVLEHLGQCSGTVLEPFTLDDAEAGTAALLARIAFSREFDQTRLRVVSNQTLGSRGGCVLTNNLKHFYAERFALGKRSRIGTDYWRYVPRNRPKFGGNKAASRSIGSASMARVSAKAELNSEGYRIRISVPDFAALKWPDSVGLTALLGRHSRVGTSTESLNDLNIGISLTSRGVNLSPASPEATMRLTAQMMSNRLLVVSPGPGHAGAATVYVRLTLPREDEDASLNTLVVLGSGYFDEWIHVEMNEGPRLSKEDRLKIAEWIMPPEDWVDEDMLETV